MAADLPSGNEVDPPSQFPPITATPDKPARVVAPASPFAIATPAHPQVNPFALPSERSAPSFSPNPMPPAGSAGSSPFQAQGSSPFGGGSPFGSSAPAPAKPVAPPAAVEEESHDDAKARAKDVARVIRRRTPLLSPKRVLGVLGGVFALLVAVVAFFPYDRFQPQIEAALSASVGQPVKVGSVGASFLPVPALVLSQVSIGQGASISVSEIRAVPSAFSLFSGKKAFSRVTIVDARVPMEQLGTLAAGIGAAGRSETFTIREVDFSGITIGLRDLSLNGYRGKAEMAADGGLKRVDLKSPDRTLSLALVAGTGGAEISIEGSGWKPGESSPYVFDSIAITGEMTGTRLQVQKVEGRIFGGVIQGQMVLDWATGMAVSGDISVDYMSAPLLAAALGSGKITVDGQANARIKFRASGENWGALSGKVPLEGDVIMKEGAIHGMDLVEAVRRGGQLAMRGGTTRFEKATGKFRWDGKALQLYEIDIASGIVRATGNLGVLKSEQISGVLNVSMRGSAGTVSTPVSVAGTLKDPQLFGGRR